MAEKMNRNILLMNFSGVYRQEQFHEKENISWVEVQDLTGTNCYCDEEAKAEIEKRIGEFPVEGIHFIDSGNYHYMSRIWLERIKIPYRLLVFDNHTDMQLPAFGGILSCGGWIAAALEELPELQEVFLVGPDEEAFSKVNQNVQKKVCFLSREKWNAETEEGKSEYFEQIPTDLPLFISVDKDVLCRDDAVTTWSQGDMKLTELETCLNVILKKFRDEGQQIIGMDVCGECDPDGLADHSVNDAANRCLLEIWKNQGEQNEK